MTAPKKNTGWSQGLYSVSSTKKCTLGAIRETDDGRKFRYAKSAATLVVGGATYSPATDANFVAQIQTSGAANAKGATQVSVYVGGTAVTANMFDDGYLVVYRGGTTTAGYYYPIASHTVSAAGSEIITVNLKEPLQLATGVTDYFSVYQNPWSGIGNVTDIAVTCTGIAMAAATTGQYLWVQTGGFSTVKGGDTSAIGMTLSPSDTDYSLETASGYTGPFVGYVFGGALVSGYFTPAILVID